MTEILRNKHTGSSKPGGQFAAHSRAESAVSLGTSEYADYAPAQVDKELAVLYSEASNCTARIAQLTKSVERYEKVLDSQGPTLRRHNEAKIAEFTADIEKYQAKRDDVRAQAAPYEEEYEARGGWSRFYLVQNTGGHVHSSTHCSTCFPTTRYGWLTDNSGMTEDEIVELAGDSACTTCFPSAPVANRNAPRPNRLETPEARAEREANAREKAARDADKAAKAITTPDGEPLMTATGVGVIKTERTAEIEAVRSATEVISDGVRPIPNREWAAKYAEDVETLLAALAHKRGTTIEEQRAIVMKKAEAKYKKEWS